MGRLRWLGVPILLGILLTQMAMSSAQTSAAFDETITLVAGYSYLQTGDPRLSWEHPPLTHLLSALPLLLRDDMAPFPTDDPVWQAGNTYGFVDRYLWEDNFDNAPDLIRVGRWPMMVLTVGFGLAIFTALYQLAGELAAWIGLLLYSFDPNILANGRLIITDLAVAGFMLIAVWRLVVYFRRPGFLTFILTGLAAGLAGGSKFSAVLIVPIFLLLIWVYQPDEGHTLTIAQRLLALAGMALVAFVVLWALYGFQVGTMSESDLSIPMPTFWRGVPQVWGRIAGGTPTYLLGRTSEQGWWYYFPVVFALKTPLPLLLLIGIGLWQIRYHWRERALWWIPMGIYLLTTIISPLQIGYRHILPLLLFAIAFAAASIRHVPRSRYLNIGLGVLLLWAVLEGLGAFPGYLGYSNQLAGGSKNSWRHFADMNVDWGQDLIALKAYADANPGDEIRLAYFGSAEPAAYGLDVIDLPGFFNHVLGPEVSGFNPYTPPAGLYAISATSLHLGLVYGGQNLYAYFRDREPDSVVGRSILIYEVAYDPQMPIKRAVVSGPDVWQLSTQTLGFEDGYRLITKWSGVDTFIAAGQGPTLYVGDMPAMNVALVEQLGNSQTPVDARTHLDLIPVADTPFTLDGRPAALPVAFSNGLSLRSWDVLDKGSEDGVLDLISYWQVDEAIWPPLAVFVHLSGEDDIPVVQWDGWPVATQGLEVGDVIVLHHMIPAPARGTYSLQIGLYLPPDGPRFSASGSDRLVLTTLIYDD